MKMTVSKRSPGPVQRNDVADGHNTRFAGKDFLVGMPTLVCGRSMHLLPTCVSWRTPSSHVQNQFIQTPATFEQTTTLRSACEWEANPAHKTRRGRTSRCTATDCGDHESRQGRNLCRRLAPSTFIQTQRFPRGIRSRADTPIQRYSGSHQPTFCSPAMAVAVVFT